MGRDPALRTRIAKGMTAGSGRSVAIAALLVVMVLPLALARESRDWVGDVQLELSDEIRQYPLSTNDSIFGVCYLPPDPARTHDRGLAWRRLDCLWTTVQPTNLTWSWGAYDNDVQQAEMNNIYQIVLLCYGNPAFLDGQPKLVEAAQLDYWCEFVRQVVRRYRGNQSIIAYEVWNEANGDGFWKGSAEDYARLLARSSEVIRQEDPDALILCTGTASSVNAKLGPNEVFYERLFEWNRTNPEFAGKLVFDIYNVHAYLNNPVQYRELIRRQKAVCEKYGFDWRPKPGAARLQDRFSRIWCTEIGFGGNKTYPADLNRQMQKTVKAGTIGFFENLGRHLIYQWTWDETWVIDGKPAMDAIATIFPIWKNSTPFDQFNPGTDMGWKANAFNLYAARMNDGQIAVGYWDEQSKGTAFDITLGSDVSSLKRIILPNFTWDYTDLARRGSGDDTVTTIQDLTVDTDFQMVLVNTSKLLDRISIQVHLDVEGFFVFYFLPIAAVVVAAIVAVNLIKVAKKK